jgi:hypothetical protein
MRHGISAMAAVLAMGLAWGAAARADVFAYTVEDTNGGGGYPSGSGGTFTVPQYNDPGGKPLLKVTLTVIGHSTGGSTTVDNQAAFAGTATAGIGTEIRISGPTPALGSILIVRADPVNSVTGPVAASNEVTFGADFVGTDSLTATGTGATDTQSAFKTSAADLTPYQGAGTVSFDFTTSTNAPTVLDTGFGSNLVVFGDIRSIYTATVTYEALPEPATMSLLALGGLAMLRRRK